jgi:hypothetical protein
MGKFRVRKRVEPLNQKVDQALAVFNTLDRFK